MNYSQSNVINIVIPIFLYFYLFLLVSADEEERKVGMIAEEVSKKQQDCEEDLVKAEPALLAAQEALNTLNKVSYLFNCLINEII